nr:serine/arginine repetitive matrix protein 1-like [Globicephala melas]
MCLKFCHEMIFLPIRGKVESESPYVVRSGVLFSSPRRLQAGDFKGGFSLRLVTGAAIHGRLTHKAKTYPGSQRISKPKSSRRQKQNPRRGLGISRSSEPPGKAHLRSTGRRHVQHLLHLGRGRAESTVRGKRMAAARRPRRASLSLLSGVRAPSGRGRRAPGSGPDSGSGRRPRQPSTRGAGRPRTPRSAPPSRASPRPTKRPDPPRCS